MKRLPMVSGALSFNLRRKEDQSPQGVKAEMEGIRKVREEEKEMDGRRDKEQDRMEK